jgi:hypothetical protein
VYKRGPHLHVGGGSPNIDRAHISLCVNDNAFGGGTIEELTATFSKCVTMINDEILPRYSEQ